MPSPLTYAQTLLGLDERHGADEKSATKLINWRWDRDRSGWDNRIGYERFYQDPLRAWDPWATTGPIDSLYVWPAHSGALEHIVYETDGSIYYVMDQAQLPRVEAVDGSVAVPRHGEAPASYAPYGRFLLRAGPGGMRVLTPWPTRTTNPYSMVRQFGWGARPGRPRAIQHAVNPANYSHQEATTVWARLPTDAREPHPHGADEVGLGSLTENARNTYRWMITFVSDTGSESPISALSDPMTWVTATAVSLPYFAPRRACVLVEIPTGPPGTVARRLYRTRNTGDGSTVTDQTYYEDEIPNNSDTTYWSYRSDDQLGLPAPGLSESVPLGHQARYLAVHQGSVFADGGQASPMLLRWSRQGQPESFDALDFASVGQRDGGAITGLVAATDLLLVLRERAIDAVQGSPGAYRIIPILEGVGCHTPHACASVPELGLVMLTTDGVYAITGSLVGGGQVSARKLSDPITRTLSRATQSAQARVTAAWSPRDREWHAYFPADGDDRPSIGIVLHLDHPSIAWSVREGFPVGCLSTMHGGDLVFGHRDGTVDVGDESGLFVLSRSRIAGGTYVPASEQDPDEVIDNTPLPSTYRSAHISLPAVPQTKKHIRHVYVEALTLAGQTVFISCVKDGETTPSTTSQNVIWQRADHPAQPVLDTVLLDAATAIWQEPYVSSIRFDVAPMAASTLAWELSTVVDTVLLGHSLEGTVPGKQTIGGGV